MACVVLPLLALLVAVPPCSGTEGRAWGDIHVETMDGATYDFQRSGEFFASRSAAGDFEVQLRLESRSFPSHVSVATAVAVQVDGTRASVALGREPMLHVDGVPTTLGSDGWLDLPDGGRIEHAKRGYEIYWSDGSVLSIDVRKRHLDAFLRPSDARRGTLTGLFGNFNGVAVDDVEASIAAVDSGGRDIVREGLEDLAKTLFTDDEDDDPRLLEQRESLFEYEPGQNTYSFRKSPPTREATAEALPSGWRRRARETCEAAGVTDPKTLESCIIDVGYTRDESFTESAVAVQARSEANWDAEPAR